MDNCFQVPPFFQYASHLSEAGLFSAYSRDHWLILLGMLLVGILLFVGTRRFTQKQKFTLLLTCGIVLFFLQITHSIWLTYVGHFWEAEGLPLHLCSLQFIILPMALWSKNEIFLDFFCLSGPIGAFLFFLMPDTISGNYPNLHWQSWNSWSFHFIIFFAGMYLLFAYGYRPKYKNFSRVMGLSAILVTIAALGNLTGGNYMFFTTPPRGTPLSLFEAWFGWPWYNLATLALGTVIFFFEYKLFAFLFREKSPTLKKDAPQ